MKRAKNRLSPTLKQLISSTRRAKRSMAQAITFVDASNHRIERKKPLLAQSPVVQVAHQEPTLDEMLVAFDPTRHGGEAMAFDLYPNSSLQRQLLL